MEKFEESSPARKSHRYLDTKMNKSKQKKLPNLFVKGIDFRIRKNGERVEEERREKQE